MPKSCAVMNAASYSEWKNVSTDQLKKEIYGHAYAYYHMTPAIANLGKAGFALPVIVWATAFFPHLKDGIDIENKVDRYQAVWDTLWNY